VTATATALAGLDGEQITLTNEDVDHLRSRAGDRVLRPGDPGWEQAVRLWNGLPVRDPALVVQPRTAVEVSAAVNFARDRGIRLSVKGGGHHIAGTAVADRGLVLDLSRMRDVRVDPGARLAHVGPGCLLRDVDRAAQAHGLATRWASSRRLASPG
jgi:FAD/FMN-containing dehydrogenase